MTIQKDVCLLRRLIFIPQLQRSDSILVPTGTASFDRVLPSAAVWVSSSDERLADLCNGIKVRIHRLWSQSSERVVDFLSDHKVYHLLRRWRYGDAGYPFSSVHFTSYFNNIYVRIKFVHYTSKYLTHLSINIYIYIFIVI